MQWASPYGVAFSCGEAPAVAVSDRDNSRVTIVDVETGVCVEHITTNSRAPFHTAATESGWLIACKEGNEVELVQAGGGPRQPRTLLSVREPASLVVVPRLGLFVRSFSGAHAPQVGRGLWAKVVTPITSLIVNSSPHPPTHPPSPHSETLSRRPSCFLFPTGS